ncbi:MAG: serine hydrolase [Bdellovibrionaceae bacterium]|jgi:serine-type D-Ala-D-Ala carboxypeptidase|nr:serine hydrolase [Pseudobdellovibrionaceae bacterium]
MNIYERALDENIQFHRQSSLNLWPEATEILAIKHGRKKIHLNYGKSYEYYDLASLTKILFTTTVFMRLVEKQKLSLNDTVAKYLTDFPHKQIKIKHLLSHTSYLNWWSPYYKKLSLVKSIDEKNILLKEFILKEKLKPKFAYSDIDFWVLGLVLQEIEQSSLGDIWRKNYSKNHFFQLHFNENNKPIYKRSSYAPTEKCPWRKKHLKGEVHDDNAWAMGGIAPHAGLFGGAEDVACWAKSLRGSYLNRSKAFVSEKTAKHFLKKYKAGNDWALGFMMPTKGAASCGPHFHLNSVGHTGFTGTSFWYDLKSDLMVIVLSNRVNPTRKLNNFKSLRPMIHNWVFEALEKR